MEPSHIPVIDLHKADLMRTELLVWAHEKQLAQYVKQLYNMDLHIYTSTTETLNFHVRIHVWHITTQEQSNTVKCLHPGSDIIGHLEEHVYNEILKLNTHILELFPKKRLPTSEMWHYKASKLEDLWFVNSNMMHVLLNTLLYLNQLDKLVVQNTT